MIDTAHIGRTFGPYVTEVEAGRLRFFLKAIGETNPVFSQAIGGSRLPVPPTYCFSLEMDRDDPFDYLAILGIDLARVLHGEQSFIYHHPIFVGDKITLNTTVTDIYSKKNGALDFIVMKTDCLRSDGTLAVEMCKTIVVRNG